MQASSFVLSPVFASAPTVYSDWVGTPANAVRVAVMASISNGGNCTVTLQGSLGPNPFKAGNVPVAVDTILTEATLNNVTKQIGSTLGLLTSGTIWALWPYWRLKVSVAATQNVVAGTITFLEA